MYVTSPHALPPFVVETSAAGTRVIVGHVGLCDAFSLRDAIACCLPGPVILDCSQAVLPDSALGILALWLSDQDRPALEVHALARHGEAILRSFGCGWALPVPGPAGCPESS